MPGKVIGYRGSNYKKETRQSKENNLIHAYSSFYEWPKNKILTKTIRQEHNRQN